MLNIPSQSQISAQIIDECRTTSGCTLREPLASTSNFQQISINDHWKAVIAENVARRYGVHIDVEEKDIEALHRALCIYQLSELILDKIIRTMDFTSTLESPPPAPHIRSRGEVA